MGPFGLVRIRRDLYITVKLSTNVPLHSTRSRPGGSLIISPQVTNYPSPPTKNPVKNRNFGTTFTYEDKNTTKSMQDDSTCSRRASHPGPLISRPGSLITRP